MKKLITLGNLLIFIFTGHALALTQSSVNKSSFYPGDIVVFTITATGQNISFPIINEIHNHPILNKSSSQKLSLINGKQTRKMGQSYSFRPSNNLTIPSYEININGKKETTKSIKLTMLKPTQNQLGDDFILNIAVNKSTAFVGEDIDLIITLKRKISATASQINVNPITADGLWLKTNNKWNQQRAGDYIINTLHYQATPQRAGKIEIKPIIASIDDTINNGFFNMGRLSQKKVYSNAVELNISALPNNLIIFGDYKINTSVDKTTVAANEALNLTLKISGQGNLIDIEKFNIKIEDATIYSDEPILENNVFTQKMAIIANSDFVIPGIELNYFDKNTQNAKIISSQPIKIKVIDEKIINNIKNINQQQSTLKTKRVQNNTLKYYYLLCGIIIGGVLIWLVALIKNRKVVNHNLIRSIRYARTDKQLFDILLPLNNPNLMQILQQLEANIYNQQKHKIKRKEIIKYL